MLTCVSPKTWYEIRPLGPRAKMSAMAAVKGVETRALVPEDEDEQAGQRIEHEQGHGRPDENDGRDDHRVTLHSLMTSFTQRSTRRFRFLPTHSRSTGRSFASFMRLCTAASIVAPGSVGSM